MCAFLSTCSTGAESESIRTSFVTALDNQKELYAGYVSKSPRFGVVVNKGCTITTDVFLKLCISCGVERISLGRYGQKTPYAQFEKMYYEMYQKCVHISIDMAFTFPLEDDTAFPLFTYASNPSRASLYFHRLGQHSLNGKAVNYGMVRLGP